MRSLSGVTAFVQTAETLSFVAAGRALGISASAVGKSVARLEQELGVRLLHRTTRRVALTDEGRLFHERCRRVLDDLDEARDLLSDKAATPAGRLRVGLPTIGYRFLTPHLAEFRAANPRIELELAFDDRLVDVIESGLDVVIRSGELTDSTLVARRLGAFRLIVCAAPSYLAEAGEPRRLEDLREHACLRFRAPTTGRLQEWAFAAAPGGVAPPRTGMILNNMEAVLDAAIRGHGLAFMPDFLAAEALLDGRLRQALGRFPSPEGQFSMLWPSSRHMTPRLRAFVDHFAGRLFKTPAPDHAAG